MRIVKKQDVEVKFVDYWPEQDIVKLYKSGGWWKEHYDKSSIPSLIKGSFVFAVAVEKSSRKAVGMGRAISDGISDAYIQDLVVLDEYRGTGIGKELLIKLVKYCISKGIHWIGLISEPGNKKFFSKLGFKIMNNHDPMLYTMED